MHIERLQDIVGNKQDFVVVTDIRIPFFSLLRLLIMFYFASIIATLTIGLVVIAISYLIFGGIPNF
jgi:hypothetical protein